MLVNNAGVAVFDRFAENTLAEQINLLSLNVVALTALTRLFVAPMIERRRGRILNVASAAAFQPTPWLAVYGASKAFVLSLTESLSIELGGSGVTATALCPGFTDTPLVDSAKDANLGSFPPCSCWTQKPWREKASMPAWQAAPSASTGYRTSWRCTSNACSHAGSCARSEACSAAASNETTGAQARLHARGAWWRFEVLLERAGAGGGLLAASRPGDYLADEVQEQRR